MEGNFIQPYQGGTQSGLSRGYQVLGIAWATAFILCVLIGIILSGAFAVLLVIAATGYAAFQAFRLLSARGRALKSKDVVIWNGFARIVSWNPNEGVLFLKNKQIDFLDDNPNDGGGIRIIFPILGEEIVA